MKLKIVLLRSGAKVPQYKSAKASGFDLHACLDHPVIVRAKESKPIPTGIAIAVPPDHEAQIRPRSGLAAHYSVTVLNAPGTVDEDFTGEVQVLLVNHGDGDFVVCDGDRIAQMVIAPVTRVEFEEVSELPATERGAGGFGSTGR